MATFSVIFHSLDQVIVDSIRMLTYKYVEKNGIKAEKGLLVYKIGHENILKLVIDHEGDWLIISISEIIPYETDSWLKSVSKIEQLMIKLSKHMMQQNKKYSIKLLYSLKTAADPLNLIVQKVKVRIDEKKAKNDDLYVDIDISQYPIDKVWMSITKKTMSIYFV